MKKLMLFLVFCCVVGGTAFCSYSFLSDDGRLDTLLGMIHKGDEPAQPPKENLHGFHVTEGDTYYYDEAGKKVTGLQAIDEHFYYFAKDGIMQAGVHKDISFDDIATPCYINDEGMIGFVALHPNSPLNSGLAPQAPPEQSKDFSLDEVKSGVQDIMNRHGGKTSVYFNDLKTNQKFCLNNATMYPCCMIKTATLSTFMQQVENGEIDYNAYKHLIGPMIIDSDNTCYNRLMRGIGGGDPLLGAKRLNDYCKTIGMNESAAYHGLMPGADYFTSGSISNVSSAQDIGIYFEKLYYGQLANPAHTQEMLGLYAQCADLEGIAQGLPQGTVYAHKTGEAYACYHDGGIVYVENRPYIVVAFSDGVANNRAFLKELSAYLYNYQTAVA